MQCQEVEAIFTSHFIDENIQVVELGFKPRQVWLKSQWSSLLDFYPKMNENWLLPSRSQFSEAEGAYSLIITRDWWRMIGECIGTKVTYLRELAKERGQESFPRRNIWILKD